MLLTHSLSTRSPWRTHLLVLATLIVTSTLAALRPHWLLANPLPCGIRLLFHINCPFCGMTHDFVRLWHHQQPIDNPGSWFAALAIYLLYPLALLWAWHRKRPEVFYHPVLRGMVVSAITLLWIANNLHH